ncbi:NDMA-dependent alcohol dehydrogenase [Nocardioides zeae]|uniref:NDMA-dependent alcohol dehydrogenase n=1 Tax=Nocardioides imazamoxiresistens TaxID=3231893 RepID=A0ABU3PSB5_9ACTN|nr:NDMA-dependent alcohol dehydrogenase [Nocardioides zeae]MDT9592134.1 NDMA-dependent alcohol dehydrogenase [Nocardioides zeae]
MSKSAILWNVGDKWTVEDVQLTEPRAGEVLVKIAASGLCHSDDHYATGDQPAALPVVGGHEGAGVVEAVGPGVTRVKPGDHVVLVFNVPCGDCGYCNTGHQNLCIYNPPKADPLPPAFSARGQAVPAIAELGTFGEYTVVTEARCIKIAEDIPLASAALLGCAVITGWGAATYLGEVKPGETVVVIGSGGVGVNSLQGARSAGADIIVAVDPVEYKREQAVRFGATHTAASVEEASALIAEITKGAMADVAILSVGVGDGSVLQDTTRLTKPGGRTVITSVTPAASDTVKLNLFEFALSEKTLRGNVYGGTNVYRDVPLLLGLYQRGKLELDGLITTTYALDDINQGYADMHAGKNLRGVLVFD